MIDQDPGIGVFFGFSYFATQAPCAAGVLTQRVGLKAPFLFMNLFFDHDVSGGG